VGPGGEEKQRRPGTGNQHQIDPFSSGSITKTKPCFLCCFLVMVLEFELRASHLLGRHFSTMPQSFLLLVSFQVSSHFLSGLTLNGDPLDLCFPSSWDYECEPPRPAKPYFLQSLLTRLGDGFAPRRHGKPKAGVWGTQQERTKPEGRGGVAQASGVSY
jgi:hypothetical protein